MTLQSMKQFNRKYFPEATKREELREIQSNPRLYGRYLALRSLGKSHNDARKEILT